MQTEKTQNFVFGIYPGSAVGEGPGLIKGKPDGPEHHRFPRTLMFGASKNQWFFESAQNVCKEKNLHFWYIPTSII